MSSDSPAPPPASGIAFELKAKLTTYKFEISGAPDVPRGGRGALVPVWLEANTAAGSPSHDRVSVVGWVRRKDGSQGKDRAEVYWAAHDRVGPPQWVLNLLAANGIEWGQR